MIDMKALLFASGYRYRKNNGTNVGDVAQFENAVLLLRGNIPAIDIVAVAHSLSDECIDESIPLSRAISEYIWGDANNSIVGRFAILVRSFLLLFNAGRQAEGSKTILLGMKGVHALREISSADFLFYSGAGILNSKYLMGPAFVWLLAMLLANKLRVPYVLLGQQIGPLNTTLSRGLFRKALRGASFVGVRDHSSYQLAKDLGVKEDKLLYTGDEGLYLPPAETDKVNGYLDSLNIPQDYIAVQFRLDTNCPFHEHIEDFAALYSKIAEALHKPLVFVPFSYADAGDDREAHRLIAGKLNAPHFLVDLDGRAQFTKAILSKASLAIGVANHFCAFAASMGVPTVGIHATPYMAQKLDGLRNGRPYVMSVPIAELADVEKLARDIAAHAVQLAGMERVDYYRHRPEGYDAWFAPVKALM